MSAQLSLFYASDIHGSERVFRKFLNAAAFYKVQAVVFGGDLTGKAMIPFVETSPATFTADVFGTEHVVSEGSGLTELEQFVRDRGAYPYRTTPDEMAALQADPDLVTSVFSRLMRQTAENWVTLADERLRAAGIPALMMPGNDDEPAVKEILAQGDWITDAEDRLVHLEGYQVISFGWATTTPWHSPREITEAELGVRLKVLAAQLDVNEPVIFNFHDPPARSGLDMAYRMTDDMKVEMAGGQAMLAPVGSTSVRDLIERVQPVLSLHGHIHESRAARKIGRTVAINPGSAYTEGVLQGVIVTVKGKKVTAQQLVTG
jgi:Icc-related predicted phosphoesterase